MSMVRTRPARLAAVSIGALLAAGQLVAPSGAAAAPDDYAPRVVTRTDLDIAKALVRRGTNDSASVRVTSGAGTPKGQVTIRVAGVDSWTVTLRNGRARHSLPTNLQPGTYQVTARYHGTSGTTAVRTARAAAATGYQPSSDSGHYTVKPRNWKVLGEDASAGNGANRPGAVLGSNGGTGLGSTGADGSSELLGLLGLGMVAAGGVVLVTRRRRVTR
jgi:LPXTG-motif cell wall-anchored protein